MVTFEVRPVTLTQVPIGCEDEFTDVHEISEVSVLNRCFWIKQESEEKTKEN